MNSDDIPFDYNDDNFYDEERPLRDHSDEEQQYLDDCNERADDMRQELRSIY